MRIAFVAGLIAGVASGIVNAILKSLSMTISFLTGLFFIPLSIHTIALSEIIQGIVWGIIFGAFYAFLYDYIPGEGIKKGLVYGLIIWTIAIFRPAIIYMAHGAYSAATHGIWINFLSVWITYGLVLGLLYKPPK